jgi:hypothetical protein
LLGIQKVIFCLLKIYTNLWILGDQLIVVCESNLQVWFNQSDEHETRPTKVNFELDGNDMPGKLSGQVPSKTWKNVWNYK